MSDLDVATAVLAALLDEREQRAIEQIRAIVVACGLPYARALYQAARELCATPDASALSRGERWCLCRRGGERRTLGGVYLALKGRALDGGTARTVGKTQATALPIPAPAPRPALRKTERPMPPVEYRRRRS